MPSEVSITVYDDPTGQYGVTDYVYVELALSDRPQFMQHVKGQIVKIEHASRPAKQGDEYWTVSVVLPVEHRNILTSYSMHLVSVIHERQIITIRALQNEIIEQRQKFANIEEGYKRAIRVMTEKKQ